MNRPRSVLPGFPRSRWSLFSLVVLTFGMTTMSLRAEEKLEAIFDGKTFEGWEQHGGKAKYEIENGCVVGTTVPGQPNSFMCTKKRYGDFILELEFKVDPYLNSGVQIRSNIKGKDRVYGYQVEIDPSDRAWSAGIYDEGRRGWLNNLADNEPARKAFKQNEWNKYRVVCVGDSIKTWINGVPAADLIDSETQEGFIALQVHGFNPKKHPEGKSDVQVSWRNIRLQDLGRQSWKPIFDGKSLKGWTKQGGGVWEVKDGVLFAKNKKSEPAHGHLFFDKPVGDFTARVEYKAVSGNSGFYFRTEKRKGNVGIAGFQAEIDATKDAGGLYETHGRAWVSQPKPADVKKFFKPNDWNVMTVSAHGRRIVVHVNGRKSAELKNDPGRLEGFLALQLHGGQDMEVHFRKVELLSKH